jgi:hypothetical protein
MSLGYVLLSMSGSPSSRHARNFEVFETEATKLTSLQTQHRSLPSQQPGCRTHRAFQINPSFHQSNQTRIGPTNPHVVWGQERLLHRIR